MLQLSMSVLATGGSSADLICGSSHEKYALNEEADNVDPLQDLQALPPPILKVGDN